MAICHWTVFASDFRAFRSSSAKKKKKKHLITVEFGTEVSVNYLCSLPKLLQSDLVSKQQKKKKTLKKQYRPAFFRTLEMLPCLLWSEHKYGFFRSGNGHSVQLLESLWCGNCANLLAVSMNWSGSISCPWRRCSKDQAATHKANTHGPGEVLCIHLLSQKPVNRCEYWIINYAALIKNVIFNLRVHILL